MTVQQEALVKLGVSPDRIYIDKGLTGSNRPRPGLAWTRRWQLFVVVTRWLFPSLTAWPVQFLTPGRSQTLCNLEV